MHIRLLPALLLPFLAVAACSSTGTSSSTATSSSACTNLYSAVTEFSSRCGFGSFLPTSNDAKAKYDTVCQNALGAPGAGNAAATFQGCVDKFTSADCFEKFECFSVGGTGTLPDGSACGESVQCAGYCTTSTTKPRLSCGVCAPLVPSGGACASSEQCGRGSTCTNKKCAVTISVAAGAACRDKATSATFGSCVSGYRCGDDGTCVARSKIGEACKNFTECVGRADCVDQKCTATGGEGASCTTICASGFVCGTNKKCVKPVSVALGAECDDVRTCETGDCQGGGTSGGSDGTVTPGKCVAFLANGAACGGDGSNDSCEPFSSCFAGTCQVPNPGACK